MKIKVAREKFLKALQRVNSIVGSRTMLPVLGNVLLKAEDNILSLTATDLEVRITTTVEAEVSAAGETTLPSRKLLSLVNCFTAPELEIDVNENHHAAIRCGSSHFKLLGLGPEDFPTMTDFETVREFKTKEADFKRMLGMISYAVSAEDSRKALTGVLVSTNDNTLTLVATDGKRLAMQEKNLEFVEGTAGEAIVPIKAVNELKRLLEGENVLTVKVGEKQCRFESTNFVLTSKLVEGNYPSYRLVIPQSFTRTVEVNAAKLLSKIETVAQVLSDSSSYIILSFEENALRLQASSTEVGEGSDLVDIEYTSDPISVSFNPSFLADPLKNCGVEKIRVKINDELNPVAIEGDEGFLYVIMPIRKR